ncbi:cytochrome P450 6a2-like [Achroia grisella]|uniref:cytochrome P450 6a2-like n=1 Tax=Achroia grisella TaxID=688607 RepID=UPI0027D20423|nr:cytochrome P450 6a2-like [Achroia grisella]
MSFIVILLLIIVALVVLLAIIHYTTNGRKYWLLKKVPYREPCPIFGNFGPIFTMRQSYTKMLQFFYDKYSNEKYVGIFQARRPTLMVIDLDIVKHIFSTDFPHFSDRVSVSTDTRREPLLRNLANMSGAEWKAMRQIVTPTFSSAKMKAMFPLIAECAQTLNKVLQKGSLDEVNVHDLMTRYTTDVIGSCAFGVDPESLKNPDSPFFKMANKMLRPTLSTILKRYCRTFFPRIFRLLNLKTYSRDVETFFTSIINQVLAERRTTCVRRKDFLQLMLNEQHSQNAFPMTDALITSNSFIFMLAGLESTATTLSFCLYELAKANDIQNRIKQEISECLDRHNGLNYEAVCSMRLTTQVVLETLRLHPPTPLTTRLCTNPCTLSGTDLKIKAKDPVLIPLHCIQRDSKYFPNPDKFDPERFKDDLNPPGFIAFGDGPRSCPGVRFAQLVAVAGLASILTNYVVEPCARTTPRIHYDPRSVMLKNKGGIWLKFISLE